MRAQDSSNMKERGRSVEVERGERGCGGGRVCCLRVLMATNFFFFQKAKVIFFCSAAAHYGEEASISGRWLFGWQRSWIVFRACSLVASSARTFTRLSTRFDSVSNPIPHLLPCSQTSTSSVTSLHNQSLRYSPIVSDLIQALHIDFFLLHPAPGPPPLLISPPRFRSGT